MSEVGAIPKETIARIIDEECYVAAAGDGYYVSGIEQAAARLAAEVTTPAVTSTLSEEGRYVSVPAPKFEDLIGELQKWPATGSSDGWDAAVVARLMKRAAASIDHLQRSAPRAPDAPMTEKERLTELFKLSPSEQYRIAFIVAENVGYVLDTDPLRGLTPAVASKDAPVQSSNPKGE